MRRCHGSVMARSREYACGVSGRSGKSDVVMLPRGTPLVVADLGFLDRCDGGLVVAARAVRESPPGEGGDFTEAAGIQIGVKR